MRFAGFDLDHTLLEGDSDVLWMRRLAARQRAGELGQGRPPIDLDQLDRFLEDHAAGTLDHDAYYRFTLAPYVGTRFADHADELARFYAEELAPRLRPAVVARLEAERAGGALCVLVTATNELVARPVATALGFDGFVATQIQRERGCLTGAVLGTPSLHEGKTTRVEAWLARRGASLATLADSAFYGDSINDSFVMGHVRRPVAVGPGPRLEAIARERGWEILRP